jgi:chaperonin GroES
MILLGDKIMITKTEDGSKTASGIMMPDDEIDIQEGIVTAVGEEVKRIKVGDTIIFSRYVIDEFNTSSDKNYILKESEVIGIKE